MPTKQKISSCEHKISACEHKILACEQIISACELKGSPRKHLTRRSKRLIMRVKTLRAAFSSYLHHSESNESCLMRFRSVPRLQYLFHSFFATLRYAY